MATKVIYFTDDEAFAAAVGAGATAVVLKSGDKPLLRLRAEVAGAPSDVAFVNACSSADENCQLGRLVAEALEATDAPFFTTASKILAYRRDHLKMVAHYEGVAVAPYRRVSVAGTTATAAVDGFTFPVAVRTTDPGCDRVDTFADVDAFAARWSAAALGASEVIVEEYPFVSPDAAFAIAVYGRDRRLEPRAAVIRKGSAVPATFDFAEAEAQAKKIFLSLCEGTGAVQVAFGLRLDTTVGLVNVSADAGSCLPVADALAMVLPRTKENFQVTFHPQMRGYHVSATRDLAAGELVFDDERHAFPVVTKGHVEKHWSPRDQDTFKRYAWPLDSDAHVYAVWENDPRTWRPINHSCDPNLQFVADHSFNLEARRPIKAGEDLTLDYAMFCDQTMEPFDCFCGSATCRKRVFPTEETRAIYGVNAWNRRLPAAAATPAAQPGVASSS